MGIKFERYMEASALQQIDQIEIHKRSFADRHAGTA